MAKKIVFFRRGEDWNIPRPVPPRPAGLWQGGRCQQLCQRSLHHWQGPHRSDSGQDPQALRRLLGAPRIPGLPLFRWGHWFRIWLSDHGEVEHGLWQEVQALFLHLPCTAGKHWPRHWLMKSSLCTGNVIMGLRNVAFEKRGKLRPKKSMDCWNNVATQPDSFYFVSVVFILSVKQKQRRAVHYFLVH